MSADNLDYVHSFSQVYCGKQQSSWHGTTVQVVQPQPTLLHSSDSTTSTIRTLAATCTESDTCMNTDDQASSPNMQGHVVKRSYSHCSPANSPTKRSPLPKKRRRVRTGRESARRHITHQPALSNATYHMVFQHSSQLTSPSKSLQEFLITDKDTKTLLEVKKYVLSMHC